MAARDRVAPRGELGTCPLEPVILVAQTVRRHALEERVVLHVRRGDDDRPRARIAEQRILERGEPRRVDVLDHFHDRDGVEVAEPAVAIGERALPQVDTGALARAASRRAGGDGPPSRGTATTRRRRRPDRPTPPSAGRARACPGRSRDRRCAARRPSRSAAHDGVHALVVERTGFSIAASSASWACWVSSGSSTEPSASIRRAQVRHG